MDTYSKVSNGKIYVFQQDLASCQGVILTQDWLSENFYDNVTKSKSVQKHIRALYTYLHLQEMLSTFVNIYIFF